MAASLTRQAIRRVSAVGHIALRPTGFSRRALHLVRGSEDVYHGVHFQASRWSTSDSGSFTANLTVTSASLYRWWTGHELLANPATALWPIQRRLGFTCPEKCDLWWDVSDETDVERLGTDVSSRLREFALPFFARFAAMSCMLGAIQDGTGVPGMTAPQLPLLRAMLLIESDRRADAAACIHDALSRTGSHPFRETVLTVAKRLGPQVDAA